ncbi:replication protein A 70 kDa DNA-binding subunit D [Tanacetum coccineum]
MIHLNQLVALQKAVDVDDTIDLQNFDFQNDDFFDEFVSDLSPSYMNTLEGKTKDVSNIAKVNEGLKSSESSYVLSSIDRSKLWISLISKEIDSLQNMTNISRELSDQDPNMAESFINVVRKKMKYIVALLDTGDKIHVIVRNGRLSYLNQYFREDMVVLMRNFNVIPNTESYKFTNHPYKISFDRFSFARRSNTFNGDVNNTGFEVTKFCVIRSLNLDTDLPIENARVFDDGKDPPMIYINYQNGSKFDIVDGITKDVVVKDHNTVPLKFVARHRINEFKVAILRYGNKDFPIELHLNIVKLSKGNKQMYLTMEEKENRKLMKLKCSKHISLCDSEDKREVMEEDKEVVVLDVNFVKIVDTVKPEVDADVNDVVQLD